MIGGSCLQQTISEERFQSDSSARGSNHRGATSHGATRSSSYRRPTLVAFLVLTGMVASIVTVIPGGFVDASAVTAPVGLATSPAGGAWAVTGNGGVNGLGGAPLFGSLSGHHLAAPVVGIASTVDGLGYWLASADGGVFAFGDASYFGSLGRRRLVGPVVAIAPTPDGRGYWLASADGGVFAFGDAPFFGSLGRRRVTAPIVGFAPTKDGRGYWLAGSDGGVFAFGDAPFAGSLAGGRLPDPIVDLLANPDGAGYWLLRADGHLVSVGGAPALTPSSATGSPAVAAAVVPTGLGAWIALADGTVNPVGNVPTTVSGAAAGVALTNPATTTTVRSHRSKQSDGASAAGSGSPTPIVTAAPPGTGAPSSTPPSVTTAPSTAPPSTTQAPTPSTPSSPSPAGAEPAPTPSLPEGSMRLIFDDEFNANSLSSAWNTCWWYSPSRSGCSHDDDEGEWYTPANVSVGNGYLSLTARNQPVQGVQMSTGAPETYNYTSGMVDTRGAFDFSYGYVEWRAELPQGQGFWPALWMLPANDSWPPELDAVEVVGDQPNVANFTYLAGGSVPKQGYWRTVPNLSSGWHTFGVDWEPGRITWYIDGTPMATATNSVTNTPMYLLMNLAVGGSWPGYPDATTPFPSSLNIDYVRVWQSAS